MAHEGAVEHDEIPPGEQVSDQADGASNEPPNDERSAPDLGTEDFER